MPRGRHATPLLLLRDSFLPCPPPGSETCERSIGWQGFGKTRFAVAPLDLLLPDHHQAKKKKEKKVRCLFVCVPTTWILSAEASMVVIYDPGFSGTREINVDLVWFSFSFIGTFILFSVP